MKGSLQPATRPPHSEGYWQFMKYVIVGLAAVMVLLLALTIVVLLRLVV